MSDRKVKPKIKPIDPQSRIYHHYEYSPSEFGLWDDADDGTPVAIGSRNLVDSTIRKLPKTVTIFYYKKDSSKGFWVKKIEYVGKKEANK